MCVGDVQCPKGALKGEEYVFNILVQRKRISAIRQKIGIPSSYKKFQILDSSRTSPRQSIPYAVELSATFTFYLYSAASRNFEKGARSRTHFQKAGQPEYFWATHPFNAKHPFNIYLCITILQEAFISIITNFLFLKNT